MWTISVISKPYTLRTSMKVYTCECGEDIVLKPDNIRSKKSLGKEYDHVLWSREYSIGLNIVEALIDFTIYVNASTAVHYCPICKHLFTTLEVYEEYTKPYGFTEFTIIETYKRILLR